MTKPIEPQLYKDMLAAFCVEVYRGLESFPRMDFSSVEEKFRRSSPKGLAMAANDALEALRGASGDDRRKVASRLGARGISIELMEFLASKKFSAIIRRRIIRDEEELYLIQEALSSGRDHLGDMRSELERMIEAYVQNIS